jgi:uncharacterized membrane protein
MGVGAFPFITLALAIGIIAGLRALTAPMVVAWAAHFGWLNLHHTWAAFLGSTVTAVILSALALAELVNDQAPKTPSRKAPPSFAIRICSGAFCGAVLATGTIHSGFSGVVFGALGAVLGTLGGYDARTGLVRSLKVPDIAIALPEDALAVGGGFAIMAMIPH